MMSLSFEKEWAETLFCPYCGEGLNTIHVLSRRYGRIKDGVVGCSCTRFPVTEGIVNLGALGSAQLKAPVELLMKGDYKGACQVQLEIETLRGMNSFRVINRLVRLGLPWLGGILSAFRRHVAPPFMASDTFESALKILNIDEFGIYLKNRIAHPSLLATLPIIMLFPRLKCPRILDVGCGAGHFEYLMKRFYPEAEITCTDRFFTNLYLAQKFFLPDARYVCTDNDLKLPFSDPFDLVFSSDVLHFHDNKAMIGNEMMRLLKNDGYLVLTHLHNSSRFNIEQGYPLNPQEWRMQFPGLPTRIFNEETILMDFIQKGLVDLRQAHSSERLSDSDALCLIGNRQSDFSALFHEQLFSDLVKSPGPWVLNPLYGHDPAKQGSDAYTLFWESEKFKRECHLLEKIMPADIRIDKEIWESNGIKTAEGRFAALVKQFSILPSPANYADGKPSRAPS
jgi:SAM-dependent methyltransferase